MNSKEHVSSLLKKRATLQIFLALGFVLLNIILFFVWPKVAYLPPADDYFRLFLVPGILRLGLS